MKFLLLTAVCICSSLSLSSWAQDAPASKEVDLPQEAALKPWTGDLDGMIQRRVIRALVAPSRTSYWLNGARQTGAEYEMLKAFQEEINNRYQTHGKHIRTHVVFIPTSRDKLIAGLLEGRGDIAAGILTVTPERMEKVDFGAPFFRGVKEIVVTGPASPKLTSIDDLSGQEVFVRPSSSYWTHLEHLNERFAQEQRPPVRLKAAPEDLQDDDLLEMVNAGFVGIIVVDQYQALLWSKVFKKLTPHKKIVVHAGGDLAWMIRKDSPKLKEEIAAFAKAYGQKSDFGKALVKKYGGDGNPRVVKQATSAGEMKKFEATVKFFKAYGTQYDMDYLLMIAQGYQESLLDQNARSEVGAIGVMQLMPATGKEMDTGDITLIEPNIHAGIKYVRFLRDDFFAKEQMDARNRTLFSFAAYNAGPGRVQKLRKEAAQRGLDPNVWFNNVEIIAAKRIGEETVTYVSNIYKYYIAYKLVEDQRAENEKVRNELRHTVSGSP
ncbi:peptidoglycan lytic exotransglycosylase [Nitrospira sp. KM1]|uniref:transglycosylase SLT domain-containing protein n=1 Tax=Nitrospira sp. KM1 TaxID=1936990 RepID=UPI0013A721F3|nr:transporter substrate-binding domain-containing protein [Nitrospira sp. KM1]BCA56956.1 peptidoglycan lytic exotransglycosylase [Nitrospira sp. KM1]